MPMSSTRPTSSGGKGVKVLHIHRDAIKARLREKHARREQMLRESRLSAVREEGDEQQAQRCSPEAAASGYSDGGVNIAGTSSAMQPPCRYVTCRTSDDSWRDLGDEFGCDVTEAAVMDYLLALEEEIRQEQLIALYEEANGTNSAWDEYYQALAQQ